MSSSKLVWRQVHWPRPLDVERVASFLRMWAADPAEPRIVIETRADRSGISWHVGAEASAIYHVTRPISEQLPGSIVTEPTTPRGATLAAGRLKVSARYRPLRADAEQVTRRLLGALGRVQGSEHGVVQIVLGNRHHARALPSKPSSTASRWRWSPAMPGMITTPSDGEQRAAQRSKVGESGFACTIRVGVSADEASRRRSLLRGVVAALGAAEGPGVRVRSTPTNPRQIDDVRSPWLWPLHLNVTELLGLLALPIGDDYLPGLPPRHPRPVAPRRLASESDRIVAQATAPGVDGALGYSMTDAMRHTWIIGPNGTGKSTLLLNLIVGDMAAGRSVICIEPKDLVADVLARIPESRRDDVVVLDPADTHAVGFNPLISYGRSPDLVADALLGTFHAVYENAWGIRTADVLHAGLLTLARRDDASLAMLPLLLSRPAFRRSLTQHAMRDDPYGTGPFWSAFEKLSDAEQAQVIAPAMTRLRQWLIRPSLRAVLAQREPRFNIRQALTEPTIVLVPLQPGVLGPEGAQLMGAMILSELWTAIRERVAVPVNQRLPVSVYVDEVQQYLRLPVDLADVLATSRSLGTAWHLAHQFSHQLSPEMRAAFETNARSRIAFQLAPTDAKLMAAGQSVLEPGDFASLPVHHVYASLTQDGEVTPWASGKTLPPPPISSDPADIRARSRANYGRSLDEVEAGLTALLDTPDAPTPPTGRTTRRPRGETS